MEVWEANRARSSARTAGARYDFDFVFEIFESRSFLPVTSSTHDFILHRTFLYSIKCHCVALYIYRLQSCIRKYVDGFSGASLLVKIEDKEGWDSLYGSLMFKISPVRDWRDVRILRMEGNLNVIRGYDSRDLEKSRIQFHKINPRKFLWPSLLPLSLSLLQC